MTKKNQFIEILRFIFCLIIVIHHAGFFSNGERYLFDKGGLYAVEFFFILTGALAMKHVLKAAPEKGCMKYSMDYTINKLKRVFPYALIGIFLSYVWFFIQAPQMWSIKDRIFGRWNIVFEMLFLPMTGIMDVDLNMYLNTPLWYLSVLLIVLPLIVFWAVKYKDVYTNYVCIIVPFLLYGYMLNKYGSIGNWGVHTGFFYTGIIRGCADLMLGCLVYVLSQNLSNLKKNLKLLLTIIEIICYGFSIYTFNTNVDGYSYMAAVIFMAAGMCISLSESSYTACIKGGFFSHLGALSLPMYCLHWPIYRFLTYFNPYMELYTAVMIEIAVCILLSEISMLVVKKKTR